MKKFWNKHWPLVASFAIVFGALGVNELMSQTPVVREASLKWTAVDTDTEGKPITGVTYTVYQGAKGSTAKLKTIVVGAALNTLVTALPPGETCFNVTAKTPANGESAYSAEGCKSFPYSAPTAPSVFTVQ